MTQTQSSGEVKQHYRACHLCEAICGLVIETTGDQVLSIKGDPNDPLSRGHICPKAVALQDIHVDQDRLRKPVKRVRREGGGYQHVEIDWEEALDLAADGLIRTIREHGVDGVGAYFGNPTVHNFGMLTHQNALFRHIRTRNRYSATSVDQLPHHLISLWLFGHKLLFPIPDIDRCDYFLMLGANPLASNGSIWTVPDVKKRINALTSRGGKLVVVDPRRTETAEVASEHHAIIPGSDAALLLAIINVLSQRDWIRLGHLEACIDGLDEVISAVRPFTPGWAAEVTGLSASTIEAIARDMASAERGICYGRMGVSTQRFGALCQWAIQVINIMTGNLDREGGSLFTLPAVDQVLGTSPGGFGRHHSRVRELPEFDRELPVAALAEEILTPGEGQVRALFTGAGNPVLSTPSGAALDEALETLDFMVSLDPWINETTRHADVILPPTSPLEHDHYDLAFHVNAVRNTARYNPPVFDKPEGTMHDWEILSALGERVAKALDLEAAPVIPPDVMMDFALRAGPYGDDSEHKMSLDALKANPSGIDFGPLKPQLPDRLQTTGKRINLAVHQVLDDVVRLHEELPEADEGYRLIGRRHVRDCNSWMHNFHRLVKGRDRCTLMVNPEDAEREGWQEGERVTVASRVGSIITHVEITPSIRSGVVSLPHGFGHAREGTRMALANDNPGVSCNDITDAGFVDPLCGNAALNGVPVQVSRV
jgi:anaerobic selenocysteine-containing dehydrogenase